MVRALLRRTDAALRSTPELFAPSLAGALLVVPGVAVRPVSTGWANLLALVGALVALTAGPFVHAGAVGLADAALDGDDARLRTFLDAGRRGYLPTLAGSLGVGAGAAALAALVGLLVVVAAFASFPGRAAPPSDAAANDTGTFVTVTLAVAGAVVLAGLLVLTFVHLYAHAAVVDGHGVLGCVPRSARVVATGGTTTLGYVVVAAPVAALVGAALALSPAATDALPAPTPVAAATVGAVLVAVVTAGGGVLAALSTAYYRTATGAGA